MTLLGFRTFFGAAFLLVGLVTFSSVIPSVYGQGAFHLWEVIASMSTA